MRFDVVTLFPELFAPHLAHGITRRAFESRRGRRAAVAAARLRRRRLPPRRRPPLRRRPGHGDARRAAGARARRGARLARGGERGEGGASAAPVVHFTPTGRRLDQALVREFAAGPGAVLLCGRYEGIDQRFVDAPRRRRAEPGRLRAVGRRAAGAGAARRGGAAAARRARRRPSRTSRTASPTRPARLPALQPARGAARRAGEAPATCRRCCCRATTAPSPAGGASSRWRSRARRRPDLIAAARAAGRLSAAGRALPRRAGRRLSYNRRLFDPLPRRGSRQASSSSRARGRCLKYIPITRGTIARRTPWT